MDSAVTFRHIMGISKEKKLYFIIVFRQRFYSVYMLIVNTYCQYIFSQSVDREIVKHSSIKSHDDISKILKTVQRDLTIIFDVLSEYVIYFALNLIFLAVAFRGFISVLSIRFIRPQASSPQSCAIIFCLPSCYFFQLKAGCLICEAHQNLVKHLDM